MKVWIDTGKKEPQRDVFISLMGLCDTISRRIDRLWHIVRWIAATVAVIILNLLYRTIVEYLS